MAEPLRPAAAKLYGRRNIIFVPTIASATLAPTVAEVTGVSSLDITLIAFDAPSPTQNTNRVTQERRFGDTLTFEYVGTTSYQGGDFTYQFDSQGAALSSGVKAWEKFYAGLTGFFVDRQNVARATTPVAGQFVHVWPVEIGPSIPVPVGDGETEEGAAQATYAVTSTPGFKLAILA